MGCSKNLVDSEYLMKQLDANNFIVEHESNKNEFDYIIINTCGFINDAKEESIETILNYVKTKGEGLIKKVFVIGCLSERYKQELEKEIPEVDKYYGTNDLNKILSDLDTNFRKELINERILTTPKHYAYLKISEGCNRTCSFCAIPLMRGKYKSKPIDDLILETRKLVDKGVKEILLIAQDLSFYGYDIYKKYELAKLLEKLSDIKGIEWIRLHYLFPSDFPLDILPVIRERENICKYIDISFQHISDNMLKLMKRNFSKKQTLELISTIREQVSGIHIRTTLLTGHPGETKNDFNELIEFVKKSKFERLGVFKYSHEEDTYSYKNYEDEISDNIKQKRADKIMEIQKEISAEHNNSKINSIVKVIIDRVEGDYYIARTEFDSPEIDNEVLIKKQNIDLKIGEYYNVKIISADEFDLYADLSVKL